MQKESRYSMEKGDGNKEYDDDGRIRRTGTLMSASAHIITAVIGSGVLSLAWCFSELGWIAGTASLIIFAVITWFTCLLLSDCYRSPDPVTGTRNYNYMQAVKANLEGGHARTSLTGIPVGKDMPSVEKMWSTFSAIGDIAFAYFFCPVLLEIQDTLRSSPPENKVMKRASTVGVSASTLFYMICGTLGYAAFGNDAPGNYLTGFGFYEPFWLIDFGNLCIVIHLLGAYQVYIQPFFAFVESWSKEKWPQNKFITREYSLCKFKINIYRLTWRSAYVVLATLVAMIFPFFNSFLGLIGATTFWPLTVYFPIEMYISKAKIQKNSFTWIWMKVLSLACLIVSLVAAAGSIRGLIVSVETFKLFHSVS